MDESTEIISSSELLSTSPFEILSPDTSQDMPKPKLVKNLREFWQIGRPKSFSSMMDVSPSSATNASFRSSTASSTYESLRNAAADADLNGQVFLDDIGVQSDEGTTPTEQGSLGDSTKTYKAFTTNNGRPENLSRSFTEGEGGRKRASSCGAKSGLSSTTRVPTSEASVPQAAAADVDQADIGFNNNPMTSSSAATRDNLMTASAEYPSQMSNYHHSNSTGTNCSSAISGNKSDVGGASQGAESEHDSGHCLSESFENSVEPEFQSGSTRAPPKMPSPETLGGGNPFLMFLCLTLLLQHRDHIMKNRMDYNETAMYFDKMIRKHNVGRVLAHARQMYSNYLKQNVSHA